VFGPQGVRSLVASRRDACPNLHVKILDQVAEEDRVATRWRVTSGLKAPGARVRTFEGISIVRLLAGKQVDSYTEYAVPADDAQAKRSPAQISTGNRLAGGASGQTQPGS